MPATTIVIYEQNTTLGQRIAHAAANLPVRIREVRSATAFREAVQSGPFPVAFIEHEESLRETLDLLDACRRVQAISIIVGTLPDWPAETEVCELGATLVLPPRYEACRWPPLLRRLVELSQYRMRTANGELLPIQR